MKQLLTSPEDTQNTADKTQLVIERGTKVIANVQRRFDATQSFDDPRPLDPQAELILRKRTLIDQAQREKSKALLDELKRKMR